MNAIMHKITQPAAVNQSIKLHKDYINYMDSGILYTNTYVSVLIEITQLFTQIRPESPCNAYF